LERLDGPSEATMLLVAPTGALSFSVLRLRRANRESPQRETCKSGAEALSDTLWVLWRRLERGVARSRSSPVSNARAGDASRRPRPRWTAERFPVLSNRKMDL